MIVWQIIGDMGLEPWIKKLARIMELRKWSDAFPGQKELRRLIFARNGSDKEDAGEIPDYLENGWEVRGPKSLKMRVHQDVSDIIFEMSPESNDDLEIGRMMQASHFLHQELIKSGGLPLHAALVQRDGKGVALAASGGTGKSTCCRRIPYPWEALCDDTILVIHDGNGGFLAHPFPTWTDYLWRHSEGTWDVERCVPLKGIFFLRQAKVDEVSPAGQGEGALLVNGSAMEVCHPFWRNLEAGKRRAHRIELFSNACQLSRAIPAFILDFSLNGQFWEEIEKVLGEQLGKEIKQGDCESFFKIFLD